MKSAGAEADGIVQRQEGAKQIEEKHRECLCRLVDGRPRRALPYSR